MDVKVRIKRFFTGQNKNDTNPYMKKGLFGMAASSSIIGSFYAAGYEVDIFLLIVGLAFVAYLIYYSRKNKSKSD